MSAICKKILENAIQGFFCTLHFDTFIYNAPAVRSVCSALLQFKFATDNDGEIIVSKDCAEELTERGTKKGANRHSIDSQGRQISCAPNGHTMQQQNPCSYK